MLVAFLPKVVRQISAYVNAASLDGFRAESALLCPSLIEILTITANQRNCHNCDFEGAVLCRRSCLAAFCRSTVPENAQYYGGASIILWDHHVQGPAVRIVGCADSGGGGAGFGAARARR